MNRWIDVGYTVEEMLIGRMDGRMAGWTENFTETKPKKSQVDRLFPDFLLF